MMGMGSDMHDDPMDKYGVGFSHALLVYLVLEQCVSR